MPDDNFSDGPPPSRPQTPPRPVKDRPPASPARRRSPPKATLVGAAAAAASHAAPQASASPVAAVPVREGLGDRLQVPTFVIVVVGLALTVVGVMLTAWQTSIANNQTEMMSVSLREQRASSAWQILSTKGPGSTGKQYAIQTLIELVGDIYDVNLSCTAMGSEYVTPFNQMSLADHEMILADFPRHGLTACQVPPDLRRLSVDGAGHSKHELSRVAGSNFSGADLTGASFSNLLILDTAFDFATLSGSSFRAVTVHKASFFGATLQGSKFSEVEFDRVDFSGADISEVIFEDVVSARSINISATTICYEGKCPIGFDQALLDASYFDPGRRPKGLESLDQALLIRPACSWIGGTGVFREIEFASLGTVHCSMVQPIPISELLAN